MPIDFESVKKSYGRCMITRQTKEVFFTTFYDKFLNSHDSIREMFRNTEFEKQTTMLKNAISMAILFAEKQDDLARDFLTKIRNSHSRARRDVKPEYYTLWLDSLMETFRECDPHFSVQLEASWREMLQVTIDYIVEGYDQ